MMDLVIVFAAASCIMGLAMAPLTFITIWLGEL